MNCPSLPKPHPTQPCPLFIFPSAGDPFLSNTFTETNSHWPQGPAGPPGPPGPIGKLSPDLGFGVGLRDGRGTSAVAVRRELMLDFLPLSSALVLRISCLF